MSILKRASTKRMVFQDEATICILGAKGESTEDEDKKSQLTLECLEESNQITNGSIVVMAEDETFTRRKNYKSGLNATTHLSTETESFVPPKLETMEERIKYAAEQTKMIIPQWQKKLLRLTKTILGIVTKWDETFQKAEISLIASKPDSEFDLNSNNDLADVTTLLYIAALHISWIKPEPKDIVVLLHSIFTSLSKVADLCVTIINIINKSSQQLNVLNPILKELQQSIYDDIVKDLKDEPSVESLLEHNEKKRQATTTTTVHFNRAYKSSSSTKFSNPRQEHQPSSSAHKSHVGLNLISFILQKNKNIVIQCYDKDCRLHEITSHELESNQKLLIINILLSEIFDKLNNGFKDIVNLEVNELFQEHVYKLEVETIPEFLEEAKFIRKKYNFSSYSCCSQLRIHLESTYQKIMENRRRLNNMLKNTRWILLALESSNQQRSKWSFPHDILHLDQTEEHGVSKAKRNSFLDRIISWFLRKKENIFIHEKIIPFDRMFKNFQIENNLSVILLSIEVDNKDCQSLCGDGVQIGSPSRSMSDNDFRMSTIFLSNSEIPIERSPLTGSRKPKDKVLYLKRRMSLEGQHSSTIDLDCQVHEMSYQNTETDST